MKELRHQKGMTREALAQAATMSVSTIRGYQQSDNEPLLSNAYRLADALGVTVDDFRIVLGDGKLSKKAGKKGK